MAAANMERLLVKDKISLARKLISTLKPGKTPKQFFWILSRIGARELLYGSVDRVVSAKEVSSWIKKIYKMEWRTTDPVVLAIPQIMRKTGDRTRDVEDELVSMVIPWLQQMQATELSLKMIQHVVTIKYFEESMIYGESLPHGLVLKDTLSVRLLSFKKHL